MRINTCTPIYARIDINEQKLQVCTPLPQTIADNVAWAIGQGFTF